MAAAGENGTGDLITDSFTLCSFVDEIEGRVEILRRQATSLMGERASLLTIMAQLKDDCLKCDISSEDCQELVANMERLKNRCEAVQIQVHTVRDEGQVQSLQKVNDALKELQMRLNADDITRASVQQAQSFLNACLPEATGPVDSRFQSILLGCAVDDQKDVRRRLESTVRRCNMELQSISSQPDKLKERLPKPEQSSNPAKDVNSFKEETPASAPSDKHAANASSNNNQVENHLTAQWYSPPKDTNKTEALGDEQEEENSQLPDT